MKNEIVGYVMDVDMRLSHEGLRVIAAGKRPKLDLDALERGQFILFTNAGYTACKIFGAGNTFIYHRSRNGNPLHPRVLSRAIECFDGVRFDYKAALLDEIEARLSPEMRDWLKKHRSETLKLRKSGAVNVDLTAKKRRRKA